MDTSDNFHMSKTDNLSRMLERWRHLFQQDSVSGRADLKQLRENKHRFYLALIHELALDPDPNIRVIGLRELAFHGSKDDRNAEEAALAVLQTIDRAPPRTLERKLQVAALLVLGRLGTTRAFPALYARALDGDEVALQEAANQVRSPEQREQLVILARRFLLSGAFPSLYSALQVLGRFSTAEQEEDLLLAALKQQQPDILIEALGHASPHVLPTMRELLTTLAPDSVQYEAATAAIAELVERKQRQARLKNGDV